MKGIADTGLLVAFANRNDAHHQWAVRIAERVSEPLLTCEAVLAEAAFHLSIGVIVLAMIEDGLVTPAFDCGAHLAHLKVLAERYADRRPVPRGDQTRGPGLQGPEFDLILAGGVVT